MKYAYIYSDFSMLISVLFSGGYNLFCIYFINDGNQSTETVG